MSRDAFSFLDMAHHRRLSDLPEFLQNSPFIPLGPTDDDLHDVNQAQPKPTLGQIIRSKRFRTILISIIIALALIILPSRISSYQPLYRLGISGPKCYFKEPVNTPPIPNDVDWSQFAYSQYATTTDYLCNSIMIFEALHRYGSKADRILLHPSEFLYFTADSIESQLLKKATSEYGVKLVQIEEQHKSNVNRIWASSYTKLLAFSQTQYKRILHLDSDSSLLASLDALFFLPKSESTPEIYLPRAYWLQEPKMGSHIMLLSPSSYTFTKIQKSIQAADRNVYDMEIINSLFGNTCSLIPHREYGLLSGEFRSQDHKGFLDGAVEGKEEWDPERVMKESKFVHFSDYPFPKPWEESTVKEQSETAPKCVPRADRTQDCGARDAWVGLYREFKERRKVRWFPYLSSVV